jgi:hypothetical protein
MGESPQSTQTLNEKRAKIVHTGAAVINFEIRFKQMETRS